ncbi:Y-family DNA polymerase [uncultured Hymenobacter sp.]|uniref:Y-family DNA polymerase n=1 Tax=uncultured Hymenobacter sp. TaxID=170016 RepID=UPI0035CB712E
MFALVDCNNFYASCERVFQPRLEGQPIVVLSNNDGCIIARSNEAKVLGFRMGDPYFQVKHDLLASNVCVFSSNYALYGDMSRRVMWYLAQQAPEVEIYSIDEAFLDLHGMEKYVAPLDTFARTLRTNIKKRTGIPTCIGIAPTKTLAKLANRLAKKMPDLGGVLYLDTDEKCQWALAQVGVGDVWGIGRQYAAKLAAAGLVTAADLAGCSDAWARKQLGGVVGARLVQELRGRVCQGLAPSEDGTLARQSISCSRTFGQPLSAFNDVLAAVGAFTSRAAEKLRRQGDATHLMTVYLSKNRYGLEPPPYSCSTVLTLPVAMSDTTQLLRYARMAVKKLWQANSVYTKAGVIFDGLEPLGQTQLSLFEPAPDTGKRERLMAELDALNRRFGKNTVRMATTLVGRGKARAPWEGKAQWCSPAYTTRLEDLLQVS